MYLILEKEAMWVQTTSRQLSSHISVLENHILNSVTVNCEQPPEFHDHATFK